jgi:WD40 repeat protein
MVSGSWDKTARIWSVKNGKELLRLGPYSDWVNSVSYSPDGSSILTGSRDGNATIWDAITGVIIGNMNTNKPSSESAQNSRTNRHSVPDSWDEAMKIWISSTDGELSENPVHSSGVNSAVYSASGKLICLGLSNGTCEVWNCAQMKRMAMITCFGSVNSCCFDPSKSLVCYGDANGVLSILELIGDVDFGF